MSATIKELINGYEFAWPDIGLVARATRLRLPSDGQVKGELEVYQQQGNGRTQLLVPTQFNFSSEPTRTKYAKQLTDKLSQEIEWREVFDYLSYEVQRLTRTGDTCVEVFPDASAPAPEQLLEAIIYRAVQNIIFGEKGVAKSTLAYLLGLTVALPWHDNPLGLQVRSESIKALVLDWETDESVFRYYTSRLQKGMGIPPCSLHYRRCAMPMADDIEAIQNHIEEAKAELLIVDSLGAAAGGEAGELKGAESALRFNTALRRLRTHTGGPVTSLIIGQSPRNQDGAQKNIYGTVFFTYYARNIFELCRAQDDMEDTAHLALFHRACNLGRRIQPIGLRADYNDSTGAITIEREPVSVSEFSEKVSTTARILEILKDGAMTQKELKESLKCSYASLGMALSRLSKKQLITRVGEKWGLLADEVS